MERGRIKVESNQHDSALADFAAAIKIQPDYLMGKCGQESVLGWCIPAGCAVACKQCVEVWKCGDGVLRRVKVCEGLGGWGNSRGWQKVRQKEGAAG